jgi:hypothetical protein
MPADERPESWHVLSYAADARPTLPRWAWGVLAVLSGLHVLFLLAYTLGVVARQVEFLRSLWPDMPWDEAPVCLYLLYLAFPLLLAAPNAIPLAGFSIGLSGRRPGALFAWYTLIQLLLLAAHTLLATYLVRRGPHEVSLLSGSTLHVLILSAHDGLRLGVLPLFVLPLLPMLIPRVRRASFAERDAAVASSPPATRT